MKFIEKILLLLVLISYQLVTTSYAFDKDFPPYPNNKFPPTCKIHPLKAVTETDRNKGHFKSLYRLSDQADKLSLHLDMNYQKKVSGMYAHLSGASAKAYIKPVKIGGHPTDIHKVYWAYLNKDNRKDLIVLMKGGDGYLSAGGQLATFLLSNGKGYTAKQLVVNDLGQQDFYDYSTDHKCELLHQALVSDRKDNYWTYNIVQFIKGEMVIKNQLSRYFPKWIKMTPQPNSKASKITEKQQKALTSSYLSQIKSVK